MKVSAAFANPEKILSSHFFCMSLSEWHSGVGVCSKKCDTFVKNDLKMIRYPYPRVALTHLITTPRTKTNPSQLNQDSYGMPHLARLSDNKKL